MALLVLVIAAVVGYSYSLDPNKLCGQLLSIDCAMYTAVDQEETVCGTDKQEYTDFCMFSQARCRDHSIDIFRVGSCKDPPTTPMQTTPQTTPPTTMAATTRDPTVQLFCKHKDSIQCPDTIDIVCGSDHKFYRNTCLLAVAHCDDISLVAEKDVAVCQSS